MTHVVTELDLPALPEGIHRALAALGSKDLSAVELTEIALARIHAANPTIKAFRELINERALSDARKVDTDRAAGMSLGPLAGIPVGVKENIDVTPAYSGAGLSFRRFNKPSADAWITKALRNAGAVILGTTTTDSGAFGVQTPEVRHPQVPGLAVGGSSGGSAAALAAGFCYGAIGTDTGGSIRIPSACCATVGLKPTHGALPLEGVFPLVWSLDHVGPMARSVVDLAVVATSIEPTVFAPKPPRGTTIGYDPQYLADADPRIAREFENLFSLLKELRFSVVKVTLPRPEEVLPVHLAIFSSESAAFYLTEYAQHSAEFPPVANWMFEHLKTLRPYEYVLASRERERLTRQIDKLFDGIDFIITPTIPVVEPKAEDEGFSLGGKWYEFTPALVRNTALFDHTGHPALAMPFASLGASTAASLQIVGPLASDGAVLELGLKLEDALKLSISRSLVL